MEIATLPIPRVPDSHPAGQGSARGVGMMGNGRRVCGGGGVNEFTFFPGLHSQAQSRKNGSRGAQRREKGHHPDRDRGTEGQSMEGCEEWGASPRLVGGCSHIRPWLRRSLVN